MIKLEIKNIKMLEIVKSRVFNPKLFGQHSLKKNVGIETRRLLNDAHHGK